jgi:type II secretory pathway pseudopilin PulG
MKKRCGQSLIEILVAVAIGVILVVGALTIVTPSIKTGSDVGRIQVASGLGKQLFDNLRAASEKDWHNIDTLATSSANRYYVIASTSPFTTTSGVESVLVGTTTFTRWFYIDDVYRNVSGKIDVSGSSPDPSTKKATVVYTWPTGNNSSGTFVGYITRTHDEALLQTDWGAGANQSGPLNATSVNSKFATSVNIDYTTSSGAIVIQGF